jgi:hypothetical protein
MRESRIACTLGILVVIVIVTIAVAPSVYSQTIILGLAARTLPGELIPIIHHYHHHYGSGNRYLNNHVSN